MLLYEETNLMTDQGEGGRAEAQELHDKVT